MIRLDRPKKPATFDTDLKEAGDQVELEYQAWQSSDESDDTAPAIPEEWGKYKVYFVAAQHQKCGFCESDVVSVSPGDVEHFRPKKALRELINEGRELPHSSKVRDRTQRTLSTGYWWLAYEWTNYLLSCGICNQKWKRNFFPVADSPRQIPPSKGVQERTMLLNPFSGPDPVNHLEFAANGSVKARRSSRHGKETIRICGLDRPSLRHTRSERSVRAHRLAIEVEAARRANNQSRELEKLTRLWDNGRDDRTYAGVVRSVLKQRCNLTWDDLLERIGAGGFSEELQQVDELLGISDESDSQKLLESRRGILRSFHQLGKMKRGKHRASVEAVLNQDFNMNWAALVKELEPKVAAVGRRRRRR